MKPEAPSFALLGSGEFEPWTEEIDRWLLERARRPDGPVLVVPTASAPEGRDVFDGWARKGIDHYATLGIPVEALPLRTREDAERPDLVGRVTEASMVFFSGGNPAYLVKTLRGTAFWRALLEGIVEGLAFAGCSAGVSFLGEVVADTSAGDPRSREVWTAGLALFPRTFFAPHWDRLDQYVPGLQRSMLSAVPPRSVFLAIDERTAVVGDGSRWSVIGAGRATMRGGGSWWEWRAGERFEAPLLNGRFPE